MIVLLIIVISGCLFPFFIENESTKKEYLLNYGCMAADMLLLAIMIKTKLVSIPTYGEIETLVIGEGIILLAVLAAKLKRLTTSCHKQHQELKKKSHKAVS